jgi:phosphatidylserine decarboxylase
MTRAPSSSPVRIDPAGFPFIFGALVIAAGLGAWLGWLPALPFLVLVAFFTFFFRDPERSTPAGVTAADVLSPADGRVLVAGSPTDGAAPPGSWKQISIFLSPMDVHVNRVPAAGRVTRVTLQRGRFLPAYHHDAATANERSEIWIDHAGQSIVTRQIVGILARRVVCRLQSGASVQAGQRLGVMKFGSRMDVFVPDDATVSVRVGDVVRGGETVIAVLHSG